MSPRLLTVAALFVFAALAVIAYKVGVLGYELVPNPAPDRWSVQTEVRMRNPDERARVTFLLPADGPGQRIYDERVSADGTPSPRRALRRSTGGAWVSSARRTKASASSRPSTRS